MTVDEDRTTSTAHCLPSSPAHLNEHQTDECSLSIMTSQTVMEPLYATQPLNQQPQSTVSSTSTLPNHAADAAAGSQYHSTYPSSQLLLFATQPDTQFDHQLSLAEASQYDDDCDSSYQNNSQRSMTMDNDADAGNDQAFITQPMTQQFNIHEMRLTSPCIEGRICELQPVNDHIDANDEVMEQDIVQENVGEENTMNVLGSKQSQQPVTMNDNNDEHETNMAGDKSEEHYQPITTPAVPPPPPLALQSLANNGYTTIEISQTAQPPEKKHAVINPYAKKSPSDQISRSSSSNSSLSATNNDSSTGTSSTHNLHDKHRIQRHNAADAGNTVPRKPVYNPYAKSNTSVLGRKSVASPADCTMKAVTTPHSINLPANNATISNVGNAAKDDGVPSGTIRKPPPAAAPPPPQLPLPMQPSRRSGISISLPIYERLPSRNVAYQPAEILTVGELYRYLYQKQQHGNDDVDHHLQHHKMRQSLTADSTTESAATRNSNSGCVESDPTLFNEITSVRITGTLLCVATTNPDERGDAATDSLYGHGTYLLIGDPLETSRLLKKEVNRAVQRDPNNAKLNAVGSATATPKVGLESILKSDNASDAVSSTAINTPSAQCVDASNSVPDQTEDPSTAKPSEAKPANNGNDTTNNTVKSKPLHRGILNTQKKKLVYNGGGKRLSFGGKGLGANGRESGGSSSLLMGGRKFVTPKRIDSSANVTKRVGFSSVMKRAPFTSTRIPAAAGGGGGRTTAITSMYSTNRSSQSYSY